MTAPARCSPATALQDFHISARIERRTWYVQGRYRGEASPFVADAGETARELTGDFYGEWSGTRHFDGVAILEAALTRASEHRLQLLINHPEAPLGDVYESPCRLGDWGEYRIITTATVADR